MFSLSNNNKKWIKIDKNNHNHEDQEDKSTRSKQNTYTQNKTTLRGKILKEHEVLFCVGQLLWEHGTLECVVHTQWHSIGENCFSQCVPISYVLLVRDFVSTSSSWCWEFACFEPVQTLFIPSQLVWAHACINQSRFVGQTLFPWSHPPTPSSYNLFASSFTYKPHNLQQRPGHKHTGAIVAQTL